MRQTDDKRLCSINAVLILKAWSYLNIQKMIPGPLLDQAPLAPYIGHVTVLDQALWRPKLVMSLFQIKPCVGHYTVLDQTHGLPMLVTAQFLDQVLW